jgi:hypothetical protein
MFLMVIFTSCSNKTTETPTTIEPTTIEQTDLTTNESTTVTTVITNITTANPTTQPTTEAPTTIITTETPTTEPTTINEFLELANSLVISEEQDQNFFLPAELEYITITWSTTDDTYIEIDNSVTLVGDSFAYEVTVTQPTFEQGDQAVAITGTFQYGEEEIQRDFNILILAIPASYYLDLDLTLIQTSYIIEDEFTLPTLNYSSYQDILISSEITVYLAYNEGVFTITRPIEMDASGTISFTVTYGDASDEVTINVTIKKELEVVEGATLIISQYVEGSSYNKYIELYNATSETINLSEYTLELYSNGATSASQSITLSGTLDPGAVIVLGQTATLYNPDLLNSTVINFNGDDDLVLKHNGVIIDSFGQIGVREEIAKDVTLIRKSGITSGDTNPYDAYDLNEWDSYPIDSIEGLGSHTV